MYPLYLRRAAYGPAGHIVCGRRPVGFVRYRQQWVERGASAGELVAAALWLLLLTVLAALSKESGALLPWLLMVMEVCFSRQVGGPSQCPAACRRLGYPPASGSGCGPALPDKSAGSGAGVCRARIHLVERLLTQARVLWRYLGWLCLPNINDMGFQHDDIPLSTSLLRPFYTGSGLRLAGCGPGRIPVEAALPAVAAGSAVFPGGPEYGVQRHTAGDGVRAPQLPARHFVCLALAWAVVTAASRSARVNTWYPVFGVLAVLCLSLFIRVQTWSDELTLSRVNLAQHPQSSRSNYFYANALLRHFRQAEQLGLGQREQDESLILSRHYFERMYQTNDRDVASLVMLYYLDSVYFYPAAAAGRLAGEA